MTACITPAVRRPGRRRRSCSSSPAAIILPVAPRFAEERCSSPIRSAIGHRDRVVQRSHRSCLRPVVGWSIRPVRAAAAPDRRVAAHGRRPRAPHRRRRPAAVHRGAGPVGRGRGLLLRRRARRPRATSRPPARRGEALSFLSLSLFMGIASGPSSARRSSGSGHTSRCGSAPRSWPRSPSGSPGSTPETMPRVADRAGRPRPPFIHPAGLFPGFVILLGLWGMAGFLAFLPLYAREVGLDGAGLPLAVYAFVVVGLRIVGARVPDRIGAARLSSAALACAPSGWRSSASSRPRRRCSRAPLCSPSASRSRCRRSSPSPSRGSGPTSVARSSGPRRMFLDVAFGIAPVVLGLDRGREPATARRSSSPPSSRRWPRGCSSSAGAPSPRRRRSRPA